MQKQNYRCVYHSVEDKGKMPTVTTVMGRRYTNSSIAYSYRLNFIPPILNHNVTLFGDRVFEELTEMKLQM